MIHYPDMAYDGIIFDKDGTLFDYYTVWAPVFRENISFVLKQFGREDDISLKKELLQLLGIGEYAINPKGLVFKHNGPLMLFNLFLFSKRNHLPYKRLIDGFKHGYYDSQELIKDSLKKYTSSTHLVPLFQKLKDHHYAIGIATSDNAESTATCLDHLNIAPYVDMVSTYDDHFKKKPNPESFIAFCKRFSIHPKSVVVVGDALVDMKYAKRGHAGYIIGVLTGSNDIKHLSKLAQVVYPSIDDIIDDSVLF